MIGEDLAEPAGLVPCTGGECRVGGIGGTEALVDNPRCRVDTSAFEVVLESGSFVDRGRFGQGDEQD